jgi:type II secretory ATPase GspE/PulE/Tfp pilus assembly ATPase PilB-like protein
MLGLRVAPEELAALVVDRLGLLDAAEFERLRRLADRLGVPLERAVLERTGMPQAFLLRQLADAWGVGFVDPKESELSADVLRILPEPLARSAVVLPLAREGGELHLAMWDPRDRDTIQRIERLTGFTVVPHLAPEIVVRRGHLLYDDSLRALVTHSLTDADAPAADQGAWDEKSAVALLDRIIGYAAVARVSDIHVEPYELQVIIRARIDGRLRDVLSLPLSALSPLVVRVKSLASLRIDERRAPQDGQFQVDLGGFDLDFRVSTLPTVWGEKLVLRVHSREIVLQDLEDLGLTERDHEIVLRHLRRPYGMILMTGPTASGKSTSLYAMLMRLGTERQNTINISTIEDPVEYRLPRVNQVQVNAAAGITFASALRSLLRQDPDVVMVGEIRDLDTAELGVRSALVGRLLFSTLHTNDAAGAVPRLLDIGVEPFLLASTLALVVAQRLVRRICTTCRESLVPDPGTVAMLRARPDWDATVSVLRREGIVAASADPCDPLAGLRLYRGRGCPQCLGTGYRRRLAVFELLEFDDGLRAMIRERRDAAAIRAYAVGHGMKTMFQDGLAKALLGETTLDEVVRVAV